MMKLWRYLFCFYTIVCCAQRLCAQASLATDALLYSTDEGATTNLRDTVSLFTIKDILISGNKKTKAFVMLREVPFKADEQYPLNVLVEKFAETKRQLMNTGLFRSVVVSLKSLQGYDVYVSIDVKERWYIYPIPLVKTVDRNLNDWVVTQKMDLSRINYGLKLTHKNLTGRNDHLYMNLVNGYTKQVSIRYDGLYLDNKLKWSSNFNVSWGKNHEIIYNTIDNKQVAYKNNDQFTNSFLRTQLEVTYRPAIYTRHIFGFGYSFEDVADTLFKLNPTYSFQHKIIRYPDIYYRILHYNVDQIAYPKNGFVFEGSLLKRGIVSQINLWQLSAQASQYWPLNKNYTFNLRAAGVLKLPFRQTYVTKQFIGYGSMYLQGYEYNVIDGVAGGYVKAIMARQLFNTALHIPSHKFERLNNIPIALYAKVYTNTAYVYDPDPGNNYLNNRMLYTGGAGLDIVLFNDVVIKLDYSINQFGKNGLYLHNRDYF
jgi:outer membrane protein assembly factor BamA